MKICVQTAGAGAGSKPLVGDDGAREAAGLHPLQLPPAQSRPVREDAADPDQQRTRARPAGTAVIEPLRILQCIEKAPTIAFSLLNVSEIFHSCRIF